MHRRVHRNPGETCVKSCVNVGESFHCLRNLTARAAFRCPSGEENQTVKQKSLHITFKKKSLSAKVVRKPRPAKTPCVCVNSEHAGKPACQSGQLNVFGSCYQKGVLFVCLLSCSFFFPVSAGFVFDGLVILEVCRSQV